MLTIFSIVIINFINDLIIITGTINFKVWNFAFPSQENNSYKIKLIKLY